MKETKNKQRIKSKVSVFITVLCGLLSLLIAASIIYVGYILYNKGPGENYFGYILLSYLMSFAFFFFFITYVQIKIIITKGDSFSDKAWLYVAILIFVQGIAFSIICGWIAMILPAILSFVLLQKYPCFRNMLKRLI